MIKNYTSDVARTISRIEEILLKFGAKAIGKNYEGERVSSLTFQLPINGQDKLVRLPAKPAMVLAAMQEQRLFPVSWPRERRMAQAERTAWKIQQDWLEIELTNLTLNQKEPLEVFLSYLWDGEQTYYAMIKERGFRGLLMDKSEAA